ncbi:hypothetical protein WJX74_010522 [Apatococcus lobatus]|uniref:RlpA-like protein double-psi beta-barrel domain-containing protein n=1 Tax=Apatococcus lobatus TaxID=904363 RepID=A0AAW1RUR3_9CHLO
MRQGRAPHLDRYRLLLLAAAVALCLARPALSQTVVGKATYYNPDGKTGACGTSSCNSDIEAAPGDREFGGGSSPNIAAICNTKATITAPNGQSVTVPILDEREECDKDAPHIDLTAGTFKALGYDLDCGVIQGVRFGPAVSRFLL